MLEKLAALLLRARSGLCVISTVRLAVGFTVLWAGRRGMARLLRGSDLYQEMTAPGSHSEQVEEEWSLTGRDFATPGRRLRPSGALGFHSA